MNIEVDYGEAVRLLFVIFHLPLSAEIRSRSVLLPLISSRPCPGKQYTCRLAFYLARVRLEPTNQTGVRNLGSALLFVQFSRQILPAFSFFFHSFMRSAGRAGVRFRRPERLWDTMFDSIVNIWEMDNPQLEDVTFRIVHAC